MRAAASCLGDAGIAQPGVQRFARPARAGRRSTRAAGPLSAPRPRPRHPRNTCVRPSAASAAAGGQLRDLRQAADTSVTTTSPCSASQASSVSGAGRRSRRVPVARQRRLQHRSRYGRIAGVLLEDLEDRQPECVRRSVRDSSRFTLQKMLLDEVEVAGAVIFLRPFDARYGSPRPRQGGCGCFPKSSRFGPCSITRSRTFVRAAHRDRPAGRRYRPPACGSARRSPACGSPARHTRRCRPSEAA